MYLIVFFVKNSTISIFYNNISIFNFVAKKSAGRSVYLDLNFRV